jgi:hypothetical protein
MIVRNRGSVSGETSQATSKIPKVSAECRCVSSELVPVSCEETAQVKCGAELP